MMNSYWSQRVAETMESLDQEFSQGELAYLALTSKVELPIRDRLAYSLHRRFGNDAAVLVSREWKRVDLAVIVGQKPEFLLEAKAMYTFNIWDGYRIEFLNNVRNDLIKLKNNYSDNSAEKLILVLATDCDESPRKNFDGTVKYSGHLRKYDKVRRSENEIYTAAREMFGEFEYFSSGKIAGGRAFGMEASVYYWLFGPY